MGDSLPFLSGFGGLSVFGEDALNLQPAVLDPVVTFSDVDGNLDGGKLVLAGGLLDDILSVNDVGTGPGEISFNGSEITFGGMHIGTGSGGRESNPLTITFNGAATAASVEAVIENLTFQTFSDTPTATRTLELTITDAAGLAARTPATFVRLSGASNPFDGIDVGSASVPSFADLDGDGDLDALIGTNGGELRYFRNSGNAVAPMYVAGTGTDNPFNSLGVDGYSAPALCDLDGDGDPDAIVGNASGTLAYFENEGTALSPEYVQKGGAENPFDGFEFGSNSAPSFADLDADGDLDAVVGASDGQLHFLENTGTAAAPSYEERTEEADPFIGIDVGSDSKIGFTDLDADGDFDAIVGAQDGAVRYLENNGTASAPTFSFTETDRFSGVDVGFASAPALADLDGDGDLDAAVGDLFGTLAYLENSGAAPMQAEFAGRSGSDNPFDSFNFGAYSAPFLADLDSDGDLDTVVGAEAGDLHYLENTGSAVSAAYVERAGSLNPFDGFDVGSFSAPTAADLDSDGDLDLVAGTGAGTLVYFENTGTATAPAYEAQGGDYPFDGVDVSFSAIPRFGDIDGDGDLDAVVGEYFGRLAFLENTGTALAPSFVQRTGSDNPFQFFNEDRNFYLSAPDIVDVDGDGDLDVLVANGFNQRFLLENVGDRVSPQFSQSQISWSFGAHSPVFADLDGDGDVDAVSGHEYGNITYSENIGGVLPFALTVEITPHPDPSENADVMTGTPGNDVIHALGGDDVLRGRGGDDQLFGGYGNDAVHGEAGNDTLDGGAGADALDGGTGTDTVDYSSAIASAGSLGVVADLQNSAGNSGEAFGDSYASIENLIGSGFADRLGGDGGANAVQGGAGGDLIWGRAGNDALAGGAGDDRLFGGEGNDILNGGTGGDEFSGGGGSDTVDYTLAPVSAGSLGIVADLQNSAGNSGEAAGDSYTSIENLIGSGFADRLGGDGGANAILGGAGGDLIWGRAGNDALAGGAGDDRLFGGEGIDELHGGSGADTLIGGLGNDRFIFLSLEDSPQEACDSVSDFDLARDLIDLSAIDANGLAVSNQDFYFIGSQSFSGTAGELRFEAEHLLGDVDGDALADFELVLEGTLSLSADNIIL